MAAWLWEGEGKVHHITWDEGDDRAVCEKLAGLLNEADEIVGHNSDKFDIPWIRTRCAFHGIFVRPDLVGVDTLKLARKAFRFNSNKLSYITEFLGLDTKIHVDYELWKRVVLNHEAAALKLMVKYCKNDVRITADLYKKLVPYGKIKTHAGVVAGLSRASCPQCASVSCQRRGYRVTASGTKSQIMSCNECGRNFTITMTEAKKGEKADYKEV